LRRRQISVAEIVGSKVALTTMPGVLHKINGTAMKRACACGNIADAPRGLPIGVGFVLYCADCVQD
jgi:hypothetical protein